MTKEEAIKDLSKRLGKIASFFFKTYGYPPEMFWEVLNETYPTFGQKVLFMDYMYKKHKLLDNK